MEVKEWASKQQELWFEFLLFTCLLVNILDFQKCNRNFCKAHYKIFDLLNCESKCILCTKLEKLRSAQVHNKNCRLLLTPHLFDLKNRHGVTSAINKLFAWQTIDESKSISKTFDAIKTPTQLWSQVLPTLLVKAHEALNGILFIRYIKMQSVHQRIYYCEAFNRDFIKMQRMICYINWPKLI